MPFETNGSITTDNREVSVTDDWDTQNDWLAYQSKTDIQINNGIIKLAEASNIPNSEISHWPADDSNNASTLTDDTGSNDGSISGASYISNGTHGTVLSFDGVDDVVTVSNDSTLNGFDEFSLCVYVKLDEVSTNKKGTIWGDDKKLTTLLAGAAGDGKPSVYLDGNQYDCPNSIISTSTDLHFAFTWDGSQIDWYLDGSPDSTTATGSESGVGTTNNKEIGQGPFSDWIFDGWAAHLRIFDTALTDTQVNNVYNEDI